MTVALGFIPERHEVWLRTVTVKGWALKVKLIEKAAESGPVSFASIVTNVQSDPLVDHG
ncbi:hypothetical protein [Thermostaphylospora chromogena]|uniref:hypothetical protein n=1 Tax=Thermostaphylospora chromogena TaxID=35622 RepID=UPI0013F5A1FC|nr:hypothetical protein [Thermostaphylospora chromogena]